MTNFFFFSKWLCYLSLTISLSLQPYLLPNWHLIVRKTFKKSFIHRLLRLLLMSPCFSQRRGGRTETNRIKYVADTKLRLQLSTICMSYIHKSATTRKSKLHWMISVHCTNLCAEPRALWALPPLYGQIADL